jgi:hypothetical protein
LISEFGRAPSPAIASTLQRVRLIVLILAAALLLLAVTQVLLPRYLEGRIENRLERNGGSADATLEALPALRLLAHDGDRLAIEGRDLAFEVRLSSLGSRFLDDIDGFDEVHMRLRGLRADPFRVGTFLLARSEGEDGYRLRLRATTSAGALASHALPGLIGALVEGATRLGDRGARIPIAVDAVIVSEDGRARVTRARGTVAGLQVGPLVELLSAAVVSRL